MLFIARSVFLGSCSGPDQLLRFSGRAETLDQDWRERGAGAGGRMHGRRCHPRPDRCRKYAGTGGRATLYVSEYSTPEAARNGDDEKTTMQEGNNVFSPVSDRTIEGHLIHMCTGP